MSDLEVLVASSESSVIVNRSDGSQVGQEPQVLHAHFVNEGVMESEPTERPERPQMNQPRRCDCALTDPQRLQILEARQEGQVGIASVTVLQDHLDDVSTVIVNERRPQSFECSCGPTLRLLDRLILRDGYLAPFDGVLNAHRNYRDADGQPNEQQGCPESRVPSLPTEAVDGVRK